MGSLRNAVFDAVVPHLNPEWFPTSGRTLVSTLQGNRNPIDASNFSNEELDVMRDMLRHQGKDSGSVQYKDYAEYGARQRAAGGMPMSVAPSLLSAADPMGNVQTTLGRFNYSKTPDGRHVITDTYDFNPVEPGAAEVMDAASVFSPYLAIRRYAGDRIPPGSGRPVNIDLGVISPTPQTKTLR